VPWVLVLMAPAAASVPARARATRRAARTGSAMLGRCKAGARGVKISAFGLSPGCVRASSQGVSAVNAHKRSRSGFHGDSARSGLAPDPGVRRVHACGCEAGARGAKGGILGVLAMAAMAVLVPSLW
jgi:hypothetical protein